MIDKIAIDVSVGLVRAPVKRKAVGIEGMKQDELAVLGHLCGEALPEQACLHTGAKIALHPVGS